MTNSAANNVYQLNSSSKTVFKSNSETHFTKLDNDTLRLKIPGDKALTAKDVLLYALSSQSDWIITVLTLARWFDVPESTIRKKLTILSNAGHARPLKIIDSKSKKITGHRWQFFEKPLREKERSGKPVADPHKLSGKERENQCAKKSAVVPIIENKQERTTTAEVPATRPKPKPKPKLKPKPKTVVADQLENYKKSIHPDIISAGLSDQTISEICGGVGFEQIIFASEKAMKPGVKNRPAYFVRMMQIKVVKPRLERKGSPDMEKVPFPNFLTTPKEKIDAVECFNRNCSRTTCSVILKNDKPSENCKKYCPYIVEKLWKLDR